MVLAPPLDAVSQNHTRRQVLLGTGALAAGTYGIVSFGSQNVSATVSGEYQIQDGETVLADTQLQDVRLTVDAAYSYDANADIHGVELELHVGATTDTLDLIARHTRDDLGTDQLSGEETLNGSLMSASDFEIADFEPENGELRTTVASELRLYVLRNEEVVADAVKATAFDVVVKNEALQVETQLGGSGSVEFDTA